MWELVIRTVDKCEYVCEFLRECSTDSSHINGAWISILILKRNSQIVYSYHYGQIEDRCDETDRLAYEEILQMFND